MDWQSRQKNEMMKESVIIIAEAGVNHNGDINKAFKLIDVAVNAGVDYVKFQTFKAENLVSRIAKKADYQIENTQNDSDNQLEMLKKLELSHAQHEQLIQYCEEKKIKFFSTAFDLTSLDFLAKIGLKIVKVPSGEITNLPYLKKAASLFEEVIISTGMAMMDEIKDALNVFLDAGIAKDKITILHCNTEYPTPMKDVNLKAMLAIEKEFGVKVGYSDHTLGIEVPIAAVALGATIIEKHFTLDKNLPGPDHAASLEPQELLAMCKAIRNIELALSGNGVKEPSESEMKNIVIARKSIVAKVNIEKGTVFTEENITTKRPGNGISAMKWDEVLGKTAMRNFNEDDLID
jgi:N-acetylneuraminate synthase